MVFPEDHTGKSVLTVIKLRHWHQEGTAEWPWHWADSIGEGWERNCWPHPHLQELLGPMEVPCSKGWHTAVPLGVFIPLSKVKDILAKLDRWPSGYLSVIMTLDKFRYRSYWLQTRNNIRKWCRHCNTCTASCETQTKGCDLVHQYNFKTSYKGTATDVTGTFLQSTKGTDTS
jgi:hypothetical protein